MGLVPAIGFSMATAVTIGLINGSIVQFLGINAFIVTLGTLTAMSIRFDSNTFSASKIWGDWIVKDATSV
ncbi:hypothetical protein ACC754_42230, partial [Rhizobium johnstonii]